MQRTFHFVLVLGLSILLLPGFSCRSSSNPFRTNPAAQTSSASDTLRVGYTYWWSQDGPFIGPCHSLYALAFRGTITGIEAPQSDPEDEFLYVPQRGFISVDEVLTVRDLPRERYTGQSTFVSDCFHQSGLEPGDQVLVFCSDYESGYSIPGAQSILKIDGSRDPLFRSIRRYIRKGQDPQAIADDLELWDGMGQGDALRRLLACRNSKPANK